MTSLFSLIPHPDLREKDRMATRRRRDKMGWWVNPIPENSLGLAEAPWATEPIEREEHGIAVLNVIVSQPERRGQSPQLVVEQCPFCGSEHYHGLPEGHRGAHCRGELGPRRGYILRIVDLTPQPWALINQRIKSWHRSPRKIDGSAFDSATATG